MDTLNLYEGLWTFFYAYRNFNVIKHRFIYPDNGIQVLNTELNLIILTFLGIYMKKFNSKSEHLPIFVIIENYFYTLNLNF